jgi:hypothetical protein
VEAKRNTNTLFARHAAVAFKLKFQCGLGCHAAKQKIQEATSGN